MQSFAGPWRARAPFTTPFPMNQSEALMVSQARERALVMELESAKSALSRALADNASLQAGDFQAVLERRLAAQKAEFEREKAEALERREWLRSPEGVLTVFTIAAQNGYCAKEFQNLSRAFRHDEQLWDAIKDRYGPSRRTYLMHAAKKGDAERVRWLLKRSAKVDVVSPCGSALNLACKGRHLGIASQLIDKGASVQLSAADGMTPLMWASNAGHSKLFQLLMEKGANVNAARTSDGSTALHLSLGSTRQEISLQLIANGANVNARRTDDATPLLLLCMYKGSLEVARDLLDKGANIDAVYTKNDFFGESVKTALLIACEKGLSDVALLLIGRGANVHAIEPAFGDTALKLACEKGLEEVSSALIEKGVDVHATAVNLKNALMCASKKGLLDIVRMLTGKGANVNAVDRDGSNSLMMASSKGHSNIAQLLIAHGANVNKARSHDRFTALMKASANGHLETVRVLVDKGADVNAAERVSEESCEMDGSDGRESGRTPLILACLHGHLGVASFLIQRGAQVGTRTSTGMNALMLASKKGHEDVARLLLDNGSELNATTEWCHHTALMLASKWGHLGVVQLLLSRGADKKAKDRVKRSACALATNPAIKAALKAHKG